MDKTLIAEADVRAYLERIADSNVLGRGARRSALLEYLVRAKVDDKGDKIKAYSIGVDVFGKMQDFDPTTDSSVRVEVGRLRTAISLFEASEWADTAIKVEIPLGTYQPEITKREFEAEQTKQLPPVKGATAPSSHPPPAGASIKPMGLLLGLLVALVVGGISIVWWRSEPAVSGPPILLKVEEFGGDAIGKELSILVKHSFSNNSVVQLLDFIPTKVDDRIFVVQGNVTGASDFRRVSVELANSMTNQVVWSHVFRLNETADLQSELDEKLNGELETRLIGAAKTLLEKRDIDDLTPEQLFILGTWVSGPAVSTLEWETERVTLMKLALEKDPDFGPAHSVLADKYGFLANVHPDWDTEKNLELSRFHAERAIELAPLDSNAMFNVAQSYWHTGRHEDSQLIFSRVTELDSGNSLARFFAKVVPYWCSDVPDEVMTWALEFDANLSSDDPIRWIVLTWIATLHANRQEYKPALQAATDASQIFQVGYTYMAHAMLLNKAGQPNAANTIIQRQEANWPGIGSEHYSGSSIPRLCSEQADAERFINDYLDLAKAIERSE